jgi:hypothetical protein
MMAQAIRAVLLAIAIAACFFDMRPSSFVTQGCLSGRFSVATVDVLVDAYRFGFTLSAWPVQVMVACAGSDARRLLALYATTSMAFSPGSGASSRLTS